MLQNREYRRVLLADVNDVLDEQGRPIGEIRASESVRREIKSEYVLCPYSGSRSHTPHLMNVSALDQVTSNWPSVLGILQYVRKAYVRKAYVADSASELPLIELARIAAAVLSVPAYVLYSEPCSLPSRSVPAPFAAAHKMCAGLFGLCKNRLLSEVAAGKPYEEVTESAHSLYRFAEESAALLSRTGIEACAGPPVLMNDALSLLVAGSCRSAIDTGLAESLINSQESLIEYAAAVIDLTLWLNVFVVTFQDAVAEICSRIEKLSGSCDNELIKRAISDARDYKHDGFSDATVAGVFQFPQGVRTEYAQGATVLFSDRRHRKIQELLKADSTLPMDREVDSGTRSLIHSLEKKMNTRSAEFVAAGIHKAIILENEAVCIFFDLQTRLHRALNWPAVSRDEASATLASVFGLLPGAYVKKVFGCGPLNFALARINAL